MDGHSGWRSRYLRRRRLRLAGLAAAGALLILALAQSCESWMEPTSSRTTLSSGTAEGGQRAGGAEEDERAAEKQGQEAPYAAIPPPEDAEPLTNGPADAGETTTGGQDGEFPAGRTLLGGAEDASDGPLKDNRLVTFYGHPNSPQMGILGRLTPGQMMQQLERQAGAYSAADPERPAVPTIELIASVAHRTPGADGLYVTQTPTSQIERYSNLAERNDALLLLDVQLGRDDLMQEVRRLEPFLKQDHVHLAIDTEYAVGLGQVPGLDLGTVDGSDVQRAVRYMDRIVEDEDVPDKLVLVHQFETGIVTGKQSIEPTDNVQVALNADGFGRPAAKLSKYDILVRQQNVQYGGFKLFYNQDYPLLTPDEALRQEPSPAVINYQ